MPLIRATLVADASDYPLFLEDFVRISVRQRRANACPPLISVARSGRAVWIEERGFATLRSAAQTWRAGWGDCKHYSVWLAADLRVSGDAAAHVRVKYVGPSRYHAVVVDGNGKVRDPSKLLGMRTRT